MARQQNSAKRVDWRELIAGQEDFVRPLIEEVVQQVLGPAAECSYISAARLEEERVELGEAVFRQEYLCEFLAAPTQMFSDELVQGAVMAEEGQGVLARHSDYYVGLDLGLKRD